MDVQLIEHGRKLVGEGRVYKLQLSAEAYTAQVLAGFLPYQPTIYIDENSFMYSCDCGDRDICSHVVALLLFARDKDVAIPHELVKLLTGGVKKSQAPANTASIRRGVANEKDLFDESLYQPSLFDLPSPVAAPTPRPEVAVVINDPIDLPPSVKSPVSAAMQSRAGAFKVFAPLQSAVPEWRPDDGQLQTVVPRAVLHVSESLGKAEIRLFFSYTGSEIDFHDTRDWLKLAPDQSGNDCFARRDKAAEAVQRERFMQRIEPYMVWERGLYADMVSHTQVSEWGLDCGISDFLQQTGAELVDEGWELRLAGKRLVGRGKLCLRAESEMDWFGIQAGIRLDAEAGLPDDARAIMTIIDSGHEHEALVQTEAGYVVCSKSDIRRLAYLRSQGMNARGFVEGSPVNLSLVDALYDSLENRDNALIQSGRNAILDLKGILQAAYSQVRTGEHEIGPEFDIPDQPSGLQARLRTYQHLGYAWLCALHRHGFGGILADDMGLGKTVQTLALLESLRARQELGPSLLIAPVVTLANWEAELQRFTPELSFVRHQGLRRSQDGSSLRNCNLVLVSYQTLRNDLDLFAAHTWDYVILDEAHYIKNASSQIFKAIRILSGKHRLSLSGTPVENNTMELWAQFSFLNPGLLGTQEHFHEHFAMPIEKQGDNEAAIMLRDIIAPFMLRRRKEEVLSELPAKEELIQWVEMGEEQARVYESCRTMYRDRILGLIDEKGLAASRMDVLRFILRLRQIAIAPVLADPAWAHIPSAKFELLMCMLDELMEENNKVLLFSQFTKTLDLLGVEFDRKSWLYSKLTGTTKDREAQIEAFRRDSDRSIFMLSLKAGGVGINLTHANYVILLDPWWNPAAESQAVDRAYRMGQTRKVTAYKFITRGSIEEKILKLQERKQQLQDLLVSPDGQSLANLTQEDVLRLFDA